MKINSSNIPTSAQHDTSKTETSSNNSSFPYKTKSDKPRSKNIFYNFLSKLVQLAKKIKNYTTKKNTSPNSKVQPNPSQKENYMALHGLLDSSKRSPFSEAAQQAVLQAQKDLGDLTGGNANILLAPSITSLQMRLSEIKEPFTPSSLEEELTKEIKMTLLKNYTTGLLKSELQKRKIPTDEGSMATLLHSGSQEIKGLVNQPTDIIVKETKNLISQLANQSESIKNFTETKCLILSIFTEGATKHTGQTESEVKASPEYKELDSKMKKERDKIENTHQKDNPKHTMPISTQIFREALFNVAEPYFKKHGIQSSHM